MDDFLAKIETYAAALGLKPGTVVQYAGKLGGSTWQKWKSGKASPNQRTMARIERYIDANPPPRPAPAPREATPREDAA